MLKPGDENSQERYYSQEMKDAIAKKDAIARR
jgi:hypothetical protein